MSDGYIPIKAIATREGVSYLTALRWVQHGKIQGLFKGGRWIVLEVEYLRFKIEGNRQEVSHANSNGD